MLSIRRLPVPVIARVHGIATAAGCQLVASCDLAVAAESAKPTVTMRLQPCETRLSMLGA